MKVNHREGVGIDDFPIARQLNFIDCDHERIIKGPWLREEILAADCWMIEDAVLVWRKLFRFIPRALMSVSE